MIQRLTIIGVGLIGGSFGLALKRAGFSGEIVGGGRREAALVKAVERGAIDTWNTDLAASVRDTDLVLLCVPMMAMKSVVQSIADALPQNAIVTDAGSSKASFVRDVAELPNQRRIVPGHPIAGKEHSGIEAADAALFERHRVLLTPTEQSGETEVATVTGLWQMTGAQVETLDVELHDRVLAATSHLPHVLAFGLVSCLAAMQDEQEIFRYAAGGFRDFTRIASSDPVMWRDICVSNRESLLEALQRFRHDLDHLTALIDSGDAEAIEQLFASARHARETHLQDLRAEES